MLVSVIIGIALFFSAITGVVMMTDVFGIYPQIVEMGSYVLQLTHVNFYTMSCFNVLKLISVNQTFTINDKDSMNFAMSCPANMAEIRLNLTKVS